MKSETPEVAFRRVCQVAAIAESSRLEGTLDWLIQVLMYYYDGPWRSADDWFESVQSTFSIELGLHDIRQSLERLVNSKHLTFDSYRNEYQLSGWAQQATGARLEVAKGLEIRVEDHWYDSVRELLPAESRSTVWNLLLEYAASAFRVHGSDAIQLLAIEDDTPSAHEESNLKLLSDILQREGIVEPERSGYIQAVSAFFTSSDAETVEYIVQLADSTFNLMALTIDEETRQELKETLPPLKIFVDTNILFSLLGTHDTPLAAATIDLFRVIKQNQLPFKLYCHGKTIDELTRTLDGAVARLTSRAWPQQISRALTSLPWQHSRLTGIESRFHQLNAEQPTSPRTFAARFASPIALLGDEGVQIYREQEVAQNTERMELRATIAEEYKEFLQRNPRRRKASYEKLDHDARLWMVAKDNQLPNRKATLFSGSFVLSSDLQFWRFDRTVLRKQYATKPVVVLPDALLQALRPFIGAGSQFDDAALARLFSAAEFRGAETESYADTVQRVASYLATFADLPEETARRILTDSMLMERIGKADESSSEFKDPIRDAIVEHNELLVLQRDELLEEREIDLSLAQQALGHITADTAVSEEIRATLSELVEHLASGRQSQIGKVVFGNVFENQNSEIVAQGSHAQVNDSTITQQQLSVDVSDPVLVSELIAIKTELLRRASTGADYESVAGIQSAVEAAEEKDESSVVRYLKKAGTKALDVALEIGSKVAIKALESAMGSST